MTVREVTWRLVVPPTWGTRGDPRWLPAEGSEGWARVFAAEDFAADALGRNLPVPWRVVAESSHLLSSVLAHYRLQLRIAEDEAAACSASAEHLAALARAGAGTASPSRSHPPGPWRVRALQDGDRITVARYRSVDGAEGDVVARRTGDDALLCWAEPDLGPVPAVSPYCGWQPRVDPELRRAAFAVEDAAAALCAGAVGGATGPDVLDDRLLRLLAQTAWRSICEYRTLMAGIWTDLERCARSAEHEVGATAAMAEATRGAEARASRRWRHLVLAGRGASAAPVEVSVHHDRRAAAASVAVARAIDATTIRWSEPVDGPARPGVDVGVAPR